MLVNVKDNMKAFETHLKRISIMAPDMKTSSHNFSEEYKGSIVATLEMKLLQVGFKFKQIHQTRTANPTSPNPAIKDSPNISRSLFLEQSQDEMMEEVAASEYKDIEKSIGKISEMYKETLSVVRMHEFMVDSITSNIDETDEHVEGGKRHLSEAHRREAKNRPLIYKVFITLYVLVFVYIVFIP